MCIILTKSLYKNTKINFGYPFIVKREREPFPRHARVKYEYLNLIMSTMVYSIHTVEFKKGSK